MEDKNILRIWCMIGITVMAVAGVVGSCTIHAQSALERMVSAGADPIIVSCALPLPQGNCDAAIAQGRR